MAELNFENDCAIDLDNLHIEWANHAYTRKKYADEVAFQDKKIKQQNKAIDVKKAKLKEETGRLILQIKGLDPKMTVQQVDATVAGHAQLKPFEKDLSSAQDELIEMEYNLNMARNALKAMDDKKSALENEVDLWSRDYFATPREKRPIEPGKQIQGIKQKGVDEKVKTSRETVNQGRRRRSE